MADLSAFYSNYTLFTHLPHLKNTQKWADTDFNLIVIKPFPVSLFKSSEGGRFKRAGHSDRD